jgi:hypothetical protein
MILRPLKMSDVGSLIGIFSDLEAKRYYRGPRAEARRRTGQISSPRGYSHAVDPSRLSRA